jgi:xanthine dehydrogenase accessory factor
MYVFGAIDFASAVARIGKFMGYRVTVCDARAVFATRERFPSADEIVVAWPDEFLRTASVDSRTVICVLTHDPKFDVPVLKAALATPAGYIGAMGSRRTHNKRTARLLEEGVTQEELERISSPIGLDIGSRTPEETAIAIAAEIIAFRTGHSGGRLAERSGPIHAPEQDTATSPDARDAKWGAAGAAARKG